MLVKREMGMKANLRMSGVLVVLLGLVIGGAALAQPTQRQNAAPGADCGRWGDGPGPGMMDGWRGGPGMMGYGAGPAMMRGYGMGPRAMMRDAWEGGLDLTDEQRTRINRIQDETRKNHWSLMGSIMDQEAKLRDLYDAPKRDSAAIDSTYKSIDGMRQQMIAASADARKRIEAVLTKKQLDMLRTYETQQDELGW
jgi:Spy/CpxP family protein refolding chaperone